jgi:hypothetical protein
METTCYCRADSAALWGCDKRYLNCVTNNYTASMLNNSLLVGAIENSLLFSSERFLLYSYLCAWI